jgi:hypothetical protein
MTEMANPVRENRSTQFRMPEKAHPNTLMKTPHDRATVIGADDRDERSQNGSRQEENYGARSPPQRCRGTREFAPVFLPVLRDTENQQKGS